MKDLKNMVADLNTNLNPIKDSKTLNGLVPVLIKSNIVLLRDEITDITSQFKDTGLESMLPNIINSMKIGNVLSLGDSLSEIPDKLDTLESKSLLIRKNSHCLAKGISNFIENNS